MHNQFRVEVGFIRNKASISSGVNTLGMLIIAAALGLGSAVTQIAAAGEAEFAIGTRLANMLRASRSVISANQPLINNPGVGDKSFTSQKVINDAESNYVKRVGAPLLADDLSARDRRLLDAQRQAMQKVVDAHQDEINRLGVGFKGFIPAIFARLANEEFGVIAGQEARIRVTAPPELVRNRKARPDPWEKNIIETRMQALDWPKGEPFTEDVEFEGRPAFRMLLPEYYRESCLSCHGEPRGEMDITNYPKEGGKIGDLAGAISIVIFK
jgi:hypothetical protein